MTSSPSPDIEFDIHACDHPVPAAERERIMEVPGFGDKDLEIIVEPLHLAISGKRETKENEQNGKMIRCESHAERIFRVVDLPPFVDTSRVSTTLRDGILIVNLPKARNAERVPVKPIAS